MFVKINTLSIAFYYSIPYPSIKTKSLFTSKFFSKNTSIYPEENKFLSSYSKASCENSAVGKSKSFSSWDFPTGWMHLLPAAKLKMPIPSSMLKTTSGTCFRFKFPLSKDD